MSRWAERFAALSGAYDTSDKRDTRSIPASNGPSSVTSVKIVALPERPSGPEPKAAEFLDSEGRADPSVPCVKSVTQRRGNSAVEGTSSSESGFDARATLATQADSLEERAALIEYGADVPLRWAEGYAALCSMATPSGFSAERWRRIVDATGAFIERWAAIAIECGWSDLDIFGCDPDRPDKRFDAMGLVLLLDRCKIVGIDERGADLVSGTGIRQRFRRRSVPVGTVSLWELRRR